MPNGWVSIRVCLPLEAAIQLKNTEKKLRQQLIKTNLLKDVL